MNNSEHHPLVSIGLPVYNGEKYLEKSIDSILAQTFTDLELIICDNASTDRTSEICQKYAASDPRVRYFHNPTNVGGANNHNLTFKHSRGKYFRWASHDDLVEPALIEKCVAVLESNPAIVLCHTDIVAIDEHGSVKEVISRNHASSPKSWERFATLASAKDFCEESYGLIRADVFGKTPLQKDYTGSDRTLVSEISLYGQFYNIPEPLFKKRFHPGNVYLDWRTRMAWFGKKYEGKIVLPWWIQFFDYLKMIGRVPLTGYEKIRCYLYMLRWLTIYGPKMVKDLLVAAYMIVQSPEQRRQKVRKTANWG